jgi:hypothetical protein
LAYLASVYVRCQLSAAARLRPSLLLDVTWQMLVRVVGCRPFKVGPAVYPAVSVTNCQPTPPNVPEERKCRVFLSFSGVVDFSVLLRYDAVSLVICS